MRKLNQTPIHILRNMHSRGTSQHNISENKNVNPNLISEELDLLIRLHATLNTTRYGKLYDTNGYLVKDTNQQEPIVESVVESVEEAVVESVEESVEEAVVESVV